jgi:ribose transport system substrate-binding protein
MLVGISGLRSMVRRHSAQNVLVGTGALVSTVMLVAACAGGSSPTAANTSANTTGWSAPGPDPAQELAKLEGGVLALGPNGEAPVSAATLSLSDAEVQQIRDKHATAAIVFHSTAGVWATAQQEAQQAEFDKLGIKVVAATNANFVASTQVSDIETVLALKPDIIVSIPVDAEAEAPAYKKAAQQGVKLVFMDNIPKGFVAGQDYVSDVSADNTGNGVVAGYLCAQAMQGTGTIGLAYYNDLSFFVTKERYDGFKSTIEKYPGIKIVEEQGVGGPDFVANTDRVASAMLIKHPDLTALWGNWSDFAQGSLSAARTAGRNNLAICTEDLDENMALSMLQGGPVKALGSQRPYDQGTAEATLAGYALIGKPAPPYVALPALGVTKDNVLDAWRSVYHQEPSQALLDAAGSK